MDQKEFHQTFDGAEEVIRKMRDDIIGILNRAFRYDDKPHQLYSHIQRMARQYEKDPAVLDTILRLMEKEYMRPRGWRTIMGNDSKVSFGDVVWESRDEPEPLGVVIAVGPPHVIYTYNGDKKLLLDPEELYWTMVDR